LVMRRRLGEGQGQDGQQQQRQQQQPARQSCCLEI
ncbi:hypothetical protein AALP_AAs58908U000100, partial [Arabis alpina]